MGNKRSNQKTTQVNVRELRDAVAALRALADDLSDAAERMESSEHQSAHSTNLETAMKSLVHLQKFVNGVAGTATTARSRSVVDGAIAGLVESLAAARLSGDDDVPTEASRVVSKNRKKSS